MNKEEILKKEMNDSEMETVNGGAAGGRGGCNGNYYSEKCSATVEEGSWCMLDDYCSLFSSTYTFVSKEDRDRGQES